MVETAIALRLFPHGLPAGVMVCSTAIVNVTQYDDGMWQWHLFDATAQEVP